MESNSGKAVLSVLVMTDLPVNVKGEAFKKIKKSFFEKYLTNNLAYISDCV